MGSFLAERKVKIIRPQNFTRFLKDSFVLLLQGVGKDLGAKDDCISWKYARKELSAKRCLFVSPGGDGVSRTREWRDFLCEKFSG